MTLSLSLSLSYFKNKVFVKEIVLGVTFSIAFLFGFWSFGENNITTCNKML